MVKSCICKDFCDRWEEFLSLKTNKTSLIVLGWGEGDCFFMTYKVNRREMGPVNFFDSLFSEALSM